MSDRFIVLLGLSIGSTIGGYVPTLFGASFFSPWGIVGNAVGGLVGIYISYKYVVQ